MRRRAAVTVALLIALGVTAEPAIADPPDCVGGGLFGGCNIEAEAPGGAGGGGANSTPVSGGSSGGSQQCTFRGARVDCVTDAGVWDGTMWCKAVDPQPPFEDSIWQGRTEGVIVRCTGVTLDDAAGIAEPSTLVVTFWQESAPGVTGPSPRELADRAVEAMDLRAGQIGTAPPSGSMGIVGVPVWLWVSDPGESTTGPITRSASAGGVTVSATGRLDRIVYSLGDGSQIQCGAGTAYQASYGDAASPDCGHIYDSTSAGEPGRAYTISATSYWTVTWSGGGQSGTIPLDFTRTTTLRVGEVQVIVTDG